MQIRNTLWYFNILLGVIFLLSSCSLTQPRLDTFSLNCPKSYRLSWCQVREAAKLLMEDLKKEYELSVENDPPLTTTAVAANLLDEPLDLTPLFGIMEEGILEFELGTLIPSQEEVLFLQNEPNGPTLPRNYNPKAEVVLLAWISMYPASDISEWRLKKETVFRDDETVKDYEIQLKLIETKGKERVLWIGRRIILVGVNSGQFYHFKYSH